MLLGTTEIILLVQPQSIEKSLTLSAFSLTMMPLYQSRPHLNLTKSPQER